ncbi:protein claret segregational [Coccinella septempunctata]|uniref:protein claret segregational n=1 Tax=Coccinella septempunctata TaxID=41139 RepID=UPI001D05D688|nr:protein claret segregational [Coccinella septempunctata]
MSRIPKFESKSRKPSTTDEVPDLIHNVRKPILRRSNSFDTLNVASSKQIISSRNLLGNNRKLVNSSNTLSKGATSSKSGKSSTEDHVPELPSIGGKPRTIMRRSRSFSDLRTCTKSIQPLSKVNSGRTLATNINANKLPKCGSSMKPNSSKPIIKPTIMSKAPIKRPGGTCDSEVKNKVMKKTKVPDWDYKTRFFLLQDTFKKLQEDMKVYEKRVQDAKITCQDLQSSQQSFREEIEKLTSMNDELTKHQEELRQKYQEKCTELENLKETFANIHSKYERYYEEAQNLSKDKENLLNEVFQGEKLRRILHNQIQDLKGNIRVFCRVRPALNELEKINQCNFSFSDNNSIEIARLRGSLAPGGVVKANDAQEFKFDRVFDQNATQEDLFQELSQLIQSAMDGYHVCVFAYGQTGSGKTYTMQGEQHPKESLGMIPRSVELIFNRKMEMEKKGWSFKIDASFLEIYNENIRDLMKIKDEKPLEIKFNKGKGTTVTNLTIMPISSAEELLQYVFQAQQNRSIAVTNFNEHSSRSHAVTKLYIEARYNNSDDVYIGSISLVDLAGSESAKTVSNERLAETKNINKSLSSLGNVMMALYKKETHVPYRNSKLTFLLQSSLGGNCKCLMIVNVSPVNDSYNESINTLRFAAKVKEVKITANQNRTLVTPSK